MRGEETIKAIRFGIYGEGLTATTVTTTRLESMGEGEQ